MLLCVRTNAIKSACKVLGPFNLIRLSDRLYKQLCHLVCTYMSSAHYKLDIAELKNILCNMSVK